MWFSLFIGALFLLILWDYFNKKHRNEILRKSKFVNFFNLPVLGNSLQLLGINAENNGAVLNAFMKKHGKFFYNWSLNHLVVFCADPKVLETLLRSTVHIQKNNDYEILSTWLGDGILVSTGKKWHRRRKIIAPTFHFKNLEDYVEIFDRQSNVMVEKLKAKAKESKDTVVDIYPLICLTAVDIIAETTMGVKIHAQLNPHIGYIKSVHIVTSIIADRLRNPFWRTDGMFKLFAPHVYAKMMKHIDLMQKFTKNIIETRRETLEKIMKEHDGATTKETNDDSEEIGGKKHMALLDILLRASVDGKPLSNEDIWEEVETFMFEGHDTTASGVSYALYMISRHPEVQEKLRKEIFEVFGNDINQPATYRQLQSLRYMECVLKESMRLYPPVPIIGRYFKEDTDLNGVVIPGDSHFNVPLFVVFRDPAYFKDPNDFKPERFESATGNDSFPFVYTPFSAGPRNCIGQKYAMLEMKSVISKILRHFELLPLGSDVVPLFYGILRSKTGMQMGLKERVYAK